MEAWAGRLAVAMMAASAPLCRGAENPEFRIARDLRSLQENPIPALSADEGYLLAARRDGLAPPAGGTSQRQAVLSRVFPHLEFPDSSVRRMLLSEAFVFAHCPEQREPAQTAAWERYAALAARIPDSLLPPWDALKPFLLAREMEQVPACRAKLLVKASPGSFREECAENPRRDAADPEAAALEALPWSPVCLQIRSMPPAACLVLSKDGKQCRMTVDDFNAYAADSRIPAAGALAEGRAELLRTALAQDFRGRVARVAGQKPGPGAPGKAAPAWKTAVRFRAASDPSRLDPGGKRWLRGYLEDLPRELYPLRDSTKDFSAPIRRETRYGHFLIEFDPRGSGPATVDGSLLGGARELAAALGRAPEILGKNAALFYGRWPALYSHPDTLAYSLWLAPSPDPDSAAYRPVRVVSASVGNAVDSIAWRLSRRKGADTLAGPFQTAYGSVLLRLQGLAPGGGMIPFDSAKEYVRIHMARGFVLGSALGLILDAGWAGEASPAGSPQEVPVPAFKDKDELVQAVARLRYGPGGAQKTQLETLARSSRPILEEMYRIHKREAEVSAWMRSLATTPEAERLGIRL